MFLLQGLKVNMKRLYNLITEFQFQRCIKQDKYRKLFFSFCFFYFVLFERRKFLMFGWNIVYEFNDLDFEVQKRDYFFELFYNFKYFFVFVFVVIFVGFDKINKGFILIIDC